MDELQQLLDNDNDFLASYLMSLNSGQSAVDERSPEEVDDYYDVMNDEEDNSELSSIYDDNFEYGLDNENSDLFSEDNTYNEEPNDNSFLWNYLLGDAYPSNLTYGDYGDPSTNIPSKNGISVKDAIVNNESGGNYGATNPNSSATGKYQFIWSIWKDKIGAVTGMKTKQDFLNNPEAQDQFYSWYEKNEMAPAVGRLQKYNNQNLTQVQLGRLFHYLGEKGSRDYLQGKIGDNPGGANNPSISKYLNKYKQTGGTVKPFSYQLPGLVSDNDVKKNLSNQITGKIYNENKPISHVTPTSVGMIKQAALDLVMGRETAMDMYGIYNQLADYRSNHIKNQDNVMTPEELNYRERLAKAFKYDYPSDISTLQAGVSRFKNNETQVQKRVKPSSDSLRTELVQQYFGINNQPTYVVDAQYKPSQAKNSNTAYKDFSPAVRNDIIQNNSYESLLKLANAKQPSKLGNTQSNYNALGHLGNFKLSHGKDERGEYISYWDNWDIDPPLLVNQGINLDKLNYPYEIYGRLYKSDFPQSQVKKQNGGNIPIAYTLQDQYVGLNNDALQELLLPLQGENIIRGLDSGEPVLIKDAKGKQKILKGPKDQVIATGNVYEKRLTKRK